MVVIIHAVLIAALATVVFGQPGMSFTVSTNGRCGKKLGTTCPGNSCCSQNNMCGHSDSDCGDGCQIGYGLCSEIRSSITLSSKVTIYDGQCGPEFKIKCFKNRCCSKKGYCGLGSYYCQAGCKKGYGDCWGTNTPSILNSNFVYNPSNSCGPDVNIRCGDKKCCSIGGVCGSSNYHCGVGCQGRYGSCSKAGTSTDLISVLPKSNIKHPISKNNRCGKKFGTRCPGQKCCSGKGFCGKTPSHCGKNCQKDFGSCSKAETSTELISVLPKSSIRHLISKNNRCGKKFGTRCPGQKCCSGKGFCGKTPSHCGKNCQKDFGSCSKAGTSTDLISVLPKSSIRHLISKNNRCGKKFGTRCPGQKCCSGKGFCGKTPSHCGKNCQKDFGSCSKAETSTELISVLPKSNIKHPISKNNRCGKKFGTRCPGQKCCSGKGFCGKTPSHCGKNCQKSFGSCSKAKTVLKSKAEL